MGGHSSDKTIAGASQQSTEQLVVAGSAVLLASLFGNGLNYLFGVFLARTLGAEQFGLYALGLTFFSTLVLVVPMGTETGTVRFISERRERHELAGVEDIVLQAIAVTVLASVLVAICLAGLAPLISERLYAKPGLTNVLALFAWAIPLSAVTAVLLAVLQAHQTLRPLIAVRYVWEPVGKFLLAATLLWAGWGLAGVLGAIVLTLSTSLVLAFYFLRKSVPNLVRRGGRRGFLGTGAFLAYCLPLAVAALFGVVTPRTDIFMLGSWATAQEIGMYQAAFQTASALALILGALEASLTPFFGQMHARGDIDGLRHLYQTASKLVLMCTMPLFVVLAVFNREMLSLFGPEFAAGGFVLSILAAGQLLSSAGGSPNNLLLMAGHSRLVMWNTVGMGLFSIGVFALLIPFWGLRGAAIGAAISQVAGVALRIAQVWRLHGIHPFTQHLLKPLCAGAVAAGFALIVRPAMMTAWWPALAIGTGLVYVAVLIGLKIEVQDKQALGALVTKVRTLVAARA
ncbi:MAG: flippase [Nitrospiraceae bacterium]|nr:flippase [Nitrospiraceae bacterium]